MVLGGLMSLVAAAWKFLGLGNSAFREGPLDPLYALARRIPKVDTEGEFGDIEDGIDGIILKDERPVAASGDESAVDAATLNVVAPSAGEPDT